jgi:hypothetical protein
MMFSRLTTFFVTISFLWDTSSAQDTTNKFGTIGGNNNWDINLNNVAIDFASADANEFIFTYDHADIFAAVSSLAELEIRDPDCSAANPDRAGLTHASDTDINAAITTSALTVNINVDF